MSFSPIVMCELRQATRRSRTYWTRLGATTLATICAMGLLAPSFRGIIPPNQTGSALFWVISLVAFGFALLSGAYLTSDSLSEEKREGTLGLLFLTDLQAGDIVYGKLVAMSLNTFYGIISVLPVLAMSQLWGGIRPDEFWRMALLLPNTFFLSVAAGMFISSVSTRGRSAWLGTLMLLILLAAVPVGLDRLPSWNGTVTLVASPLHAYIHVFDLAYVKQPSAFWISLAVQHVLAWSALIASSCILPFTWKEAPPSPLRDRLRALWNRWTLGSAEFRKAAQAKWLSPNPIVWLGHRERHRRAAFWGFLAIFFVAWLLGIKINKAFWSRPEVMFVIAFFLHLIIKLWIALETSRRLSEDHRSGALELLLVTPVTVSELLSGILAAIKRQFLLPIAIVLGVDLLLLFTAVFSRSLPMSVVMMFLAFVGVFLTDCYTIVWVGFRQGLEAKNSTHAFLQSIFKVLFVPWGVFAVISSVIAILFFNGMPGLDSWLLATWFTTSYFFDALICGRNMQTLTENFRRIAVPQSTAAKETSFIKIVERLFPALNR